MKKVGMELEESQKKGKKEEIRKRSR